MRLGQKAFLLAIALLGTSVVTWLVATRVAQTPAQRVADAAVKAVPPVAGSVEFGVLRDELMLEGTVRPERAIALSVPPLGESVYDSVITKGNASSSLTAPAHLLSVSGVPVVLVPGTSSFYRTLALGDSGADVATLVQFLRAERRLTGAHARVDAAVLTAFRTWWVTDMKLPASLLNADASASAGGPSASAGADASAPAETSRSLQGTAAGSVSSMVIPTRLLVVVPPGAVSTRECVRKVGEKVAADGPLCTVFGGQMAVSVTSNDLARPQVKKGLPVRILSSAGDVPGVVAALDRTEGSEGESPQISVVVRPAKASSLVSGETLSVAMVLGESAGSVLSVPLAAVREGKIGQFFVVLDDAARTKVDVQVGKAYGPRVEVRSSALRAGARVLIAGDA